MKHIILIPGLEYDINNWKITKTNQESVYHYLQSKYNVIDLTLQLDKFKMNTNDLLQYIDTLIPNESYILASSFGCVTGLLYTQKYPNKIKGIMLLDPTTSKQSYRIHNIEDNIIRNNLLEMLRLQEKIKFMNECTIISHVIFPFKKLKNPDKQVNDDHVFEIFNEHFSFLRQLSHNPKSNIILHPNVSHFIHHYEPEKIKSNMDYLIN